MSSVFSVAPQSVDAGALACIVAVMNKDLISGIVVNWELLIGFLLVFIMLAGERGIWGTLGPILNRALFSRRISAGAPAGRGGAR